MGVIHPRVMCQEQKAQKNCMFREPRLHILSINISSIYILVTKQGICHGLLTEGKNGSFYIWVSSDVEPS